jgi:hypothetical protein
MLIIHNTRVSRRASRSASADPRIAVRVIEALTLLPELATRGPAQPYG